GAVYLTSAPGMIPVYIDLDGRVVTTRQVSAEDSASVLGALRWAAAPLGWHGFGHVQGRMRSFARRTAEVPNALLAAVQRSEQAYGRDDADQRAAVFFLFTEPAPGRRELFTATHRVTGDQLLTHHRLEAADMGYGKAVSLGFVLDQAPITGSLEIRRVS